MFSNFGLTELSRKVRTYPRYLAREIVARVYLVLLRSSILFPVGRPGIRPGGAVVSLTSHGKRLSSVDATVRSIMWGTSKPSRIILWVDDVAFFNAPSAGIQYLQDRGLELRLSENFGPHTKYYPYVRELDASVVAPLVTADDDVLYPPWWLERLVSAHRYQPEQIHAWRAWRIGFSGGDIAPYSEWTPCNDRSASFLNFATGVGGVIYPIEMQRALQSRGSEFLPIAPRADDVWLHSVAVEEGFLVRQLKSRPVLPLVIPRSQESALKHANVQESGNDVQIKAAYGSRALERLRQL